MKPETNAKLENLFDNDTTNSNNIFDRIQDQMTSPSVDKKIADTIDGIKKVQEEKNKKD